MPTNKSNKSNKTNKSNKITDKKKNLGQYPTTDDKLQEAVKQFIQNNPETILEPCIGHGHLVSAILQNTKKIKFCMYEIDETLIPIANINKDDIKYADFLLKPIHETFTTIVGNPPFVRTKTGNLYIDFTKKCFHLLQPNGELIFIVPSDFFKLTSAAPLIKDMMAAGTFTHIYHPHNEKLFEGANIDVLVFRYCKKSELPSTVLYNNLEMLLVHNNGLITFSGLDIVQNTTNFSDIFDICVGLVTGKEEVYKHSTLGNITVLNGEDKIEKYIFADEFPTADQAVNDYLLAHKSVLINRAITNFNEVNWFKWGAPRNMQKMRDNYGKPCIYVYNLTRKEKVAFLGTVQYFGGGLIMLLPKLQIPVNKLQEIVNYLNTPAFKHSFIFSGRFKIGQRQLCNCRTI